MLLRTKYRLVNKRDEKLAFSGGIFAHLSEKEEKKKKKQNAGKNLGVICSVCTSISE